MCSVEQKPVFRDLSGEDPDPEVTEIESLCVNCHSNGMTRLLLTRIPYFKNVVIMSFSCEDCGFENNEIQPGGAYAEQGIRWTLKVENEMDLKRQVVKSDYTSVKIPELDFEIPAQSQNGEVTTVEGIVARAVTGLSLQQAPEIKAFVPRLQALLEGTTPWTLHLEDISGNTYIENPDAPRRDPRCTRSDFPRSKQEDHQLGIFMQDEISDEPVPKTPSSLLTTSDPADHTYEQMAADEVLQFPTNCPNCNAPATTNMKLTKIPHFKEVVIMATVCDDCGHRTNEVKSGGGVEDKGVKFEVRVASREDFSRDILLSETCEFSIPELELEAGGRALGGRFTTAEGALRAARDHLASAPAATGDAATGDMQGFLLKMDEVLESRRAVTLVLDDPAGNSYAQSLADDPTEPDDGLIITRYERTFEQNDYLGLNDMKTEGYEAS